MAKKLSGQFLAIGDDAYCIWDPAPARSNREMITGYHADYFRDLAKVFGKAKEYDVSVALAIRSTYAHGLETLFALLGATLQAPHYIPGYLLLYWPRHLRLLIERIDSGLPFPCAFRQRPSSWRDVSDLIHNRMGGSEDATAIKVSFADLWASLAKDFLRIDKEYNSIKHGFRTVPDGMQWEVGPAGAEPPTTASEQEKWIPLSSSEYGSRFFRIARIPEAPPHHRQIQQSFENWSPVDMLHGLVLISVSLNNIIECLKIQNELTKPSEAVFKVPQREDAFDLPWRERFSQGQVSAHISFTAPTADDIADISKEHILSQYVLEEE